MKKLLFVLVALILISTAAFAEEAIIPVCDVTLNGTKVESEYRAYPLLQYKDIIYFPMTYYDCRYLGLTTDWDNNTSTLSIQKENISGMYRDQQGMVKNAGPQTVELCNFGVVVNGKIIRNTDLEYPLLTFREVTYFPLTWEFAHDEFGWYYSYSDEDGLVIWGDNYYTEILDLPNAATDGTLSIATDGKYYYYKGEGNTIYRAPVDDISKSELIHAFDKGGRGDHIPVIFSVQNGEVFVRYNNGYNAMSSDHYFKIVDGEMVETHEGDQRNVVAGNNFQYDLSDDMIAKGDDLIVRTHDIGFALDMTVSYIYNGIEHEVKEDGVIFGVYENDGVPERSGCFYRIDPHLLYSYGYPIDSKFLYLNGYDVENGISNLYTVDLETGEVTKVLEDVGQFYAFYWGHSGQAGARIVFWRDGQLLQYTDRTGQVNVMMESELSMQNAVARYDLVVAIGDVGRNVKLVDFGSYGESPGKILFSTEAAAASFVQDGLIGVRVVEDLPGNHPHFAAIDPVYMPYISADFADNCFYYDGVLLYVTEGKVVRVKLRYEN